MSATSAVSDILSRHPRELIDEWAGEMKRHGLERYGALEEPTRRVVELLRDASRISADATSEGYAELRAVLAEVSRSQTRAGATPRETATFVMALKKPLFRYLQDDFRTDAVALGQAIWAATELLDGLALHTTEVAAKAREELILRQEQEMMELSTPVVKLWDGVLALPLIGTLDSARTQVVMETLLTKIADDGATIAILDITGVPTVDTLTAQHLIKTVTAAKLMGAECIISGIRPQIAQTIVHLGVDLGTITTKATLADALVLALKRIGARVESVAEVAHKNRA